MTRLSMEEANKIAKAMLGPEASVWYGTPFIGKRGYCVGFRKTVKILFWTYDSPSTEYFSTGKQTLEEALRKARRLLDQIDTQVKHAKGVEEQRNREAKYLREQFLEKTDDSYLKLVRFTKTKLQPRNVPNDPEDFK